MTRAIDESAKQSYVQVQFTVAGTTYRFTNWGVTLDPGGENWLSTPSLKVVWPKNAGTLESGQCTIEVAEDDNATMSALVQLLLGDGAPTAAVPIIIKEIISPVTAGSDGSEIQPFRGKLLNATRNAGGRSGRVRFDVQSIKALLDVPLGLPCNHHCPFNLFGRGCSVQGGGSARGPQLTSEAKLVDVASISGKVVTLDADPGLTGTKSLQFGYALRNGIRVGIQGWDSGDPTRVVMRQEPPGEWEGQQVQWVPGCAKTIEACRSDWSNEDNFGGIGYALPAYNPHFEDGA